jgi:hypothetical protein
VLVEDFACIDYVWGVLYLIGRKPRDGQMLVDGTSPARLALTLNGDVTCYGSIVGRRRSFSPITP